MEGNFENNAEKIADYLENRMSPEQEQSFMQELGENNALRKQYEDALLISALLHEDLSSADADDKMMFQAADEHISMIEAAMRKEPGAISPVRVIPFYKRIRNIAAVFLIIVAAGIVFIVINKSGSRQNKIADIKTPTDTSLTIGPGKEKAPGTDTGDQHVLTIKEDKPPEVKDSFKRVKNLPDTIQKTRNTYALDDTRILNTYKKYYASYNEKEDPVEISLYYSYYKKGKYEQVIDAKESDYEVMGVENKKKLLNEYMLLYKGLSLLEQNKPQDANKAFDQILQSSPPQGRLYYSAQWYNALALLKSRDIEACISILNALIANKSVYASEAADLKSELEQK